MTTSPSNYRWATGCLGTMLALAALAGPSPESSLRSEEPVYRCRAAEVRSSIGDVGKTPFKAAAKPAADTQPPATVQNLRRVDSR